MNKAAALALVLAVAAIFAGVWYIRSADPDPVSPRAEKLEGPAPEASPPQPVVRHPIPTMPSPDAEPQPLDPQAVEEVEEALAETIDNPAEAERETVASTALPALDDSDTAVKRALDDLAGGDEFDRLFILDHIVRRIVVNIDNLPRAKLPQRNAFGKAPEGRFMVGGEEGAEYLDEKNYRRYQPYVQLLERLDAQQLAAFYIKYYPLFQSAYTDLGYPSAYFNDRLVEVIDHLLSTPKVSGRIALERPHVLFRFADEDLENLSAGQKLLIRMGPENSERVRNKLLELREVITVQAPAP